MFQLKLDTNENKHNLDFFQKKFFEKYPKINDLYNLYNNFKNIGNFNFSLMSNRMFISMHIL